MVVGAMRALPPRCVPWALKAVSSGCRGCSSSAEPGGSKPLKEWTLVVGPQGRLRVRLPCQVSVRPLDPQRYPGSDRVLVTVSGVERSARRHLEHVRVRYDEALQLLAIAAEGSMDSKAAVDVRTPGKFDLDIKTSGTGCVKVQKMECDNCKIETEKGTSVLQSIKSHKIDIRTNGGKVIGLGTLYGNTDIHATEKGSVNIEKLQGTSVNISTEDGLLKTKYLYAETSSLSSVAGDIMLGCIHGNTSLETKKGSITVDSSDGSLKASTLNGAIDVYVSQLREVDLKSQKGSITVKVPASLKAYLQLSGRKVDVSSEIELKETQSASKDDHVILSVTCGRAVDSSKAVGDEAPQQPSDAFPCCQSSSYSGSVKDKITASDTRGLMASLVLQTTQCFCSAINTEAEAIFRPTIPYPNDPGRLAPIS